MGKEVLVAWFDAVVAAVERLGLWQSLLIAVVLSVTFKIPGILKAFSKILDTVLKHRRETARISAKIANDKEKLAIAIKGKKRRVPTDKGHKGQ